MCREPENPHNKHAVALNKAEGVVGHVPCELSKIMFKFMEYGERTGSTKLYLMWH